MHGDTYEVCATDDGSFIIVTIKANPGPFGAERYEQAALTIPEADKLLAEFALASFFARLERDHEGEYTDELRENAPALSPDLLEALSQLLEPFAMTIERRDPGPCGFCGFYDDANVMAPIHGCPREAPNDAESEAEVRAITDTPRSRGRQFMDALERGADPDATLDRLLQHR